MEKGSALLLGALAIGFAKALAVLLMATPVLVSWLGAAVVSCTQIAAFAAGACGVLQFQRCRGAIGSICARLRHAHRLQAGLAHTCAVLWEARPRHGR